MHELKRKTVMSEMHDDDDDGVWGRSPQLEGKAARSAAFASSIYIYIYIYIYPWPFWLKPLA